MHGYEYILIFVVMQILPKLSNYNALNNAMNFKQILYSGKEILDSHNYCSNTSTLFNTR